MWRLIASAPDGFCHPRASMIGVLLDAIAVGMSFDAIKSHFNEKVYPLLYQRPQAPPSAGNIAIAEATIEPSCEKPNAR